ncbi:retrovirus-related pol polyprotein from transposon TNT 1-94 [Tanacetum coccineum]
MGMVDNTLFTKKKDSNLIIVQIYVDDIIFGSTCQEMCDDFAKIMHDEFEMSMMGELNFFLGLQIKQLDDGIFFNQSKYIKEMLKKFGLEDSKPIKTPMSTETKLTRDEEGESVDNTKYRGMIGTMHLGLWYPKGSSIETIVYADSDHVGDYVDRKSTSGICTFMGCCLTLWFSNKQTALAISTIKAKYVSAGKACQQALWMKQALIDYGVRLDDIPIMCDNKGAIDISKNLVQHSRTKHIEIRHHFLKDNVQKGNISIEKNIDYVDASPPDAEIVSLEVVEIVIPEVGGIDTDILLTIKDDILREKLLNVNLLIANIEALKDNPIPSSDVMTKSSSTSLNLFLEETNTFDNSLTKYKTFCFNLEEISSGNTTTRSDYSLPDYEAFYDDHIEEKSSGSTTTHVDFSQYDSFIFDLSINLFPPADRSAFYEEFAGELAHIISPPEYDCFSLKKRMSRAGRISL